MCCTNSCNFSMIIIIIMYQSVLCTCVCMCLCVCVCVCVCVLCTCAYIYMRVSCVCICICAIVHVHQLVSLCELPRPCTRSTSGTSGRASRHTCITRSISCDRDGRRCAIMRYWGSAHINTYICITNEPATGVYIMRELLFCENALICVKCGWWFTSCVVVVHTSTNQATVYCL